jgi:hypothetical protein
VIDNVLNQKIAELRGWTEFADWWRGTYPPGNGPDNAAYGKPPDGGAFRTVPNYQADWHEAGPLFDDLVDQFSVAETMYRLLDHRLEGRGEWKRPYCEMIARAWLAWKEIQE